MKRIITAGMIATMMATTAYAGSYAEVGMRIVPKKGAVMEVIKVKPDKLGRGEKEKICVREVGKAGKCKWEGAGAREGNWDFTHVK